MDVKKWHALLTAARLGSFNRAAEALGYTQSGLTYMMNSLEEEIGFPLLVRSWDGVHLTAEGTALLPEIRAVVDSDHTLCQHLAEIGGKLRQRLVIGTYASISVHWISGVIGQFRHDVPNTDIELRVGSRRELSHWLEDGSVTFTLADRLDVPSTEWLALYEDPLMAVLPKTHSAARKARFSQEDVGNLPFLLPSESAIGGADLAGLFRRRGGVQVEAEDDTVLLSMVERGVGFSVLAELSLRGRIDGVAVLPLAQPLFRHLGVTHKHSGANPAAVHRLLSLLRANMPTPQLGV